MKFWALVGIVSAFYVLVVKPLDGWMKEHDRKGSNKKAVKERQ